MFELTRSKYLLPHEQARLAALFACYRGTLKDFRNIALLELLFFSGARSSEVLDVRVGDLDLDKASVYFRGTKKSRDREIPLPQDLFDRLLSLKPSEDGRLFPFGWHQLRLIWKFYSGGVFLTAEQSKPLHSLRHTAALNLYKKTRDVKLVQTFLGHRSLTNTQIYVDFVSSTEDLRRALVG